jgi:hypothetical protein
VLPALVFVTLLHTVPLAYALTAPLPRQHQHQLCAQHASTPRMLQLRLLLDRQHAAQSNITFSGSLP